MNHPIWSTKSHGHYLGLVMSTKDRTTTKVVSAAYDHKGTHQLKPSSVQIKGQGEST